MPEADDPTVIDTLAITAEDLIAALEANARRDAGAVLRVTPPFSGRMRARLHLAGAEGGYDDTPRPIHIPPQRLLADHRDRRRRGGGDRHPAWLTRGRGPVVGVSGATPAYRSAIYLDVQFGRCAKSPQIAR